MYCISHERNTNVVLSSVKTQYFGKWTCLHCHMYEKKAYWNEFISMSSSLCLKRNTQSHCVHTFFFIKEIILFTQNIQSAQLESLFKSTGFTGVCSSLGVGLESEYMALVKLWKSLITKYSYNRKQANLR